MRFCYCELRGAFRTWGVGKLGSLSWRRRGNELGDTARYDRDMQCELPEGSGLLVWPPRQLIAWDPLEDSARRLSFLLELLQ